MEAHRVQRGSSPLPVRAECRGQPVRRRTRDDPARGHARKQTHKKPAEERLAIGERRRVAYQRLHCTRQLPALQQRPYQQASVRLLLQHHVHARHPGRGWSKSLSKGGPAQRAFLAGPAPAMVLLRLASDRFKLQLRWLLLRRRYVAGQWLSKGSQGRQGWASVE